MNYILVSTQIRCETGPTTVGDQHSDPEIMELVQAKLISRLGNTFTEYVTDWPPRMVLDRLSREGFRIITMAGIGQTCVWTMAKEAVVDRAGEERVNGGKYDLFRSMEHVLRNTQFENVVEVENALINLFNSKTIDFYARGVDLLPVKWQEVIDSEGDYFDY